ncbi:lipopolysaccharide transport system permease protein [Lysobacter niabensis]|uniref:Transport permease protein n=1 Tax=Agrilutibacter niabensis TaxID=380628 RepID=A0ABU1VTL1_9GAMM|nr:ABC transporter permease [Lysobacter niabensis]MDR7100822.1 lipopolysaccharide transport system permease protein [Lysobacter niabensis]
MIRTAVSPSRSHPTSLKEMFHSAWKHRSLIRALAYREIVGRYRGSTFGVAWSIINPLVMLLIYTFVFTSIFKMRWGSNATAATPSDFALMLFAGMLVFAFFSECLTRAPSLVFGNPNLVKKIVFPLEIQAYVTVGAALFQTAVTLVILLGAILVSKGAPPPTALLLPVVLLPLCFINLGAIWILSSLGVFLRDIGQMVGHFVMMFMFLSPMFYPVTAVPEKFRTFFFLNPLTFLMEQTRHVLLIGQAPDWLQLAQFTAVSIVFAWIGFWWFQRTRRGFADVL